MEILVVMAIMVIAGAITVPLLSTLLADSRLSAAADQVQAQLAETRARAMEEGRPWKLAYLPGTGVYQLAPEDSTEWEQTQQDPVEKLDLIRDQLPKDILFAATAEEIQGGQAAGGGGGAWETIAVYLPAGNAQDDMQVFFGQNGVWPTQVQVRALTGGIAILQPDASKTP
jgi:type II secretory pathway pseudopilin PulG